MSSYTKRALQFALLFLSFMCVGVCGMAGGIGHVANAELYWGIFWGGVLVHCAAMSWVFFGTDRS